MQKIWAPADKVLSEIGRFVLIRPIVSAVLLLTAIIITLLSNGTFKNSATTQSSYQHITIPHLDIVLSNPLIAGTQVRTLLAKAALPNHSPLSTNLPAVEPTTTAVVLPAATPVKAMETVTSGITQTQPNLIQSTIPLAALPQPAPVIMAPAVAAVTAKPPVIAKSTSLPADTTWQAFRIHRGDNLARVFKKYKINAKDATTLASLSIAKPLRHLKPGKELLLIIDNKQQLQKLSYAAGSQDELSIVRTAFGFEKESAHPLVAQAAPVAPQSINAENDLTVATNTAAIVSEAASLSYVSGEVRKSLISDARKAGLSAKQANQLAQIFNGQKVQRGNQFSVLVEEAPKANKKVSTNNILVAQLIGGDKQLQLIRFTDPKGNTNYFNPQGESLNSGILRAPVQYKRISSSFSASRFHPLLHFFRPHLGVDYAAPTGTPIKAAGDGVIAEIERTGGYGKSITIKHDAKYSTLYAHMSKFADNLRVGSVIQHGQIIGYVGSTGLATGPHLHYEIHVNNVAMNPLTVALPQAVVPKPYLNQFLAQTKILLAQLKSNKSVHLADKGETVKRS